MAEEEKKIKTEDEKTDLYEPEDTLGRRIKNTKEEADKQKMY